MSDLTETDIVAVKFSDHDLNIHKSKRYFRKGTTPILRVPHHDHRQSTIINLGNLRAELSLK